ncbi:hypothetical protein U9K49_22880 (plasmid) [Pantoea agglomerans]|uniref:hypothetical protein n=1 Tax=Enterobacter agglomerans TaxID=549 RepID=UPI002D76F930|nr:hypothetical protein [Pantoea agglomerans]WRO92887.1 hypothetical protein U9K49_22880 [Pantoea agglomerans]
MKKHPNKHIQAAIDYALENGWKKVTAGGSSHAYCRLRCGDSSDEHSSHQMSVWSTPEVPEHHAARIRRRVDECLHFKSQNRAKK